jgi:hypothetical protein
MDRMRRFGRWVLILLALIAVPLALYAFFACWIVAVALIFAWFAIQRRWKRDTQLTKWMRSLSLVNDVLKSEEEYSLKIVETQPISAGS